MMEFDRKPRKIRLISGPPAMVDAQVNEMLEQYSIVSINYATTSEGVIVTAYLILSSEIRMMQIASTGGGPVRGH
jgi:hypothetical protein